MGNILIYKVEKYKPEYFRIFSGVYEDFRSKAKQNYNFELEPLNYDDFIKSINDELINCLVLLEDEIPTGFLVYTTMISEGIELNLIHCLGGEDVNKKRKLLIEKFIELNKPLMSEKVVIYPMLGVQNEFSSEIKAYGFEIVPTKVVEIDLNDLFRRDDIKNFEFDELPEDYAVVDWSTRMFSKAVDIIHTSFKHSSDALFDTRFNSFKGTRDILKKITNNIYGTFLPSATKALLHRGNPVGFCFANLTNEQIANIPLVAIDKRHRGKGLSKYLLRSVLTDIVRMKEENIHPLETINASVDASYDEAVKMYENAGFEEKYSYAQAYHPVIS
ncbi:GNAT family N-acetyltransferase [bacterium]|nr:GNAT family N-acetyltransferase [bacterium]